MPEKELKKPRDICEDLVWEHLKKTEQPIA